MRLLKSKILLIICVLGLFSCSDEGLNELNLETTVSINLKGTQSQYDEVWIEITDVLLKLADNENDPNCWLSLKTSEKDLYRLIDISNTSDLELVSKVNIPLGVIYEIKLVFGSNNTLVIDGKSLELVTNSVYQSNSSIIIHESLLPNNYYEYNLEFDTNNSILETQNDNFYILQPLINLATTSKL